MKVLLDMNVPLKYSSLLAKADIECVRWSDIGAPNAEDSEIMAYACENNLIVLTFDLDFSAILSATQDIKPSILQMRTSILQAERAVDLIAIAMRQNNKALKEGAIISIDIRKSRLRLLPLSQ